MKNWKYILNQGFPGLHTSRAHQNSNPSASICAEVVNSASQKQKPRRNSDYVRRMRAIAVEAALVYTLHGAAKYSEYVQVLALAMTAPQKLRPQVKAAHQMVSASSVRNPDASLALVVPAFSNEKKGEYNNGRHRLTKPVWHGEQLTAMEQLEEGLNPDEKIGDLGTAYAFMEIVASAEEVAAAIERKTLTYSHEPEFPGDTYRGAIFVPIKTNMQRWERSHGNRKRGHKAGQPTINGRHVYA